MHARDPNAFSRMEDKALMYQQPFDDTVMASIVHVAFWLNDVTMLQKAVRCVKRKLPEDAIHAIREQMVVADPADRETLLQR